MSANKEDECCIRGSIHTGSPTGTMTNIAGLETYFSKTDNFTGRAVLFLTDAFGLPFINNKLLADTYAKQANVNVYMPDLFEGDPVPESAIHGVPLTAFNWAVWREKHGNKDISYPKFQKYAKELRDNHGVTKLAAIGFCFGGWISLMLGSTELVDAVAVAHPSLINFPTDIENLKKPSLFLCAENDQQFPKEKRERSEEILQDKPFEHKFVFYPGTDHGFAVRFSVENQVTAKAARDAIEQAVDFFKRNL